MDTTTHTGSPLRQRMIEGMRMRKLEVRTQEGYIRAVRKFPARTTPRIRVASANGRE